MTKAKMFNVAFALILSLLLLTPATVFAAGGQEEAGIQEGDEIEMTVLGIGGWLASELSVEMAPLFADYAKDKYGYDVEFRFEEAPFSNLLQKAATAFATKSQEYNIIISDSQWLGALSEPGWIVQMNDIIDESPVLSEIEWYDPIVKKSYMTYPDGSDNLWGLPQEGDVLVLYVRKDMLEDSTERRNFKSEYGYELPRTFEDFIDVDMEMYHEMLEFFTRPEDDFYGVAIQYSKEYDYMTGSLYPFMWSSGGEIWDPETKNVEGVLNTESNAEALETMVGLLDYAPPGCINYGIGDISQAFTQGKVFSGFQWAAEGISMIPERMKDKVIAVPPPGYRQPDGSVQRIYSLGGQPWVLNKFNDQKHMDVAIHFMEWWYQKDTQLEFARRGGNPVTAAAVNSEGFEDIQPWHRVYKYMLTEENAKDFWHEPTYSEMLSYQQEKFTSYAASALEGEDVDALEVLNDIAEEQQRILYNAGATDTPPSE